MKYKCGKPVFTFSQQEIEDLNQRTLEREVLLNQKRKEAAFYASGINEDSYGASRANFVALTEEQKNLFQAISIMIENAGIKVLVLCGKNGTGKTWAGACCIRELGGKYRKSIQICNEYEDAAKKYGKETKSGVMRSYTDTAFLLIDEVNRTTHVFEREVISYIVADRIETGKKTVVIGNCNLSELSKVLDAAVMSRIKQAGMIMELTGEDRRL